MVLICSCPSSVTGAKEYESSAAIASTSLPCASLRNSPFSFRSLSAFHCTGLWLAVMMMPPQAFSAVTAISVVGVDARPMFTTSKPIPHRVDTTMPLTISPLRRASRPTTMTLLVLVVVLRMNVAYAAVNLTMSSGERPSPGAPPIVPRMPEIDLMSDIFYGLDFYGLDCNVFRFCLGSSGCRRGRG